LECTIAGVDGVGKLRNGSERLVQFRVVESARFRDFAGSGMYTSKQWFTCIAVGDCLVDLVQDAGKGAKVHICGELELKHGKQINPVIRVQRLGVLEVKDTDGHMVKYDEVLRSRKAQKAQSKRLFGGSDG
jgi:hypothetical protein